MQLPQLKPRLVEVLVVVAAVLVAIYSVWVVRNVGASGSEGGSSPAPTQTPSASPSASPTSPPPLDSFSSALGEARNLLVIGDSTGDEPGEWVGLWAEDLGTGREVTLRPWGEGAERFSASPLVYGSGQPLTIWNLSYPGVDAPYARRVVDVPTKPDAVIVNIGHDRDRQTLRETIRTITVALERRWGSVPSAWVLQNPSTGDAGAQQEEAVDLLRTLATRRQVPVIDVHAAFREADSLEDLLADGRRPNDEGSRLWADTVGAALGG